MGSVILDLDGKPIPIDGENKGEEKFLTLKIVCLNSLFFNDKEKIVAGEEKLKRYVLGMKINVEENVELIAEEIVLLKKLIGEYQPPLIVGRAYDLLEERIAKTDPDVD